MSTHPGPANLADAHDAQDGDDTDDVDHPEIAGRRRRGGLAGRAVELIIRIPAAAVTNRERRRIVADLFPEGRRFGPFVGRFCALMGLSVLIAVMGLLADSTAVVIGAMLVAPLMTPVLGMAAAVVMGWGWRLARQSAIVALGGLGAIGLAVLTSLVFPGNPDPLPAELVARTSPNLLDLGIALAAGAVGAYAQVRRQAADALTGVAVAVALVPPLAVVGICLQLQQFQLALGASLLFLANVAGIVFAASLVFIACGFLPDHHLRAGHGPIAMGLRWACAAALLMIVPLHLGRNQVLPPTDRAEQARSAVKTYLDEHQPDAELVEVSVDTEGGQTSVEVVLTSSAPVPDVDDLATYVASELDTSVDVGLQVLESRRHKASVGPR